MAVSSGGGGHSDEETRRNKGGGRAVIHTLTHEPTEREIIEPENSTEISSST